MSAPNNQSHPPTLAWVLVDDVPRHVSDFATLPPGRRPRARCPECARPLTLKLGRVRRHHAAHAPHDYCATTQPETALHINTKYHLASHLRAAIGGNVPLIVHRACAGTHAGPCEITETAEWIREWDEVVVEAHVHTNDGGRRPDILLKHGGRPIAAIEVLVSHAVSAAKAAAFSSMDVAWIEVLADDDLTAGNSTWDIRRPLPVQHWRCPQHEVAYRAWLDAEFIRRQAEREQQRHSKVLLAARVVDVYHPGGARDRAIYRVEETLIDRRIRGLALYRGGMEIATEPADDAPEAKRAAWNRLRKALAVDVASLTRREGSFSDSPMRWATGDAASNLVEEALGDMLPGDPTPLATRYPRRWFFARGRGDWFLPQDMRGVRWDRPPNDVFAPHPAWAATRSVVRERPSPDGSWSTFVFASRPIGAMFGPLGTSVRQEGAISIIDVDAADGAAQAVAVLAAAVADDDIARVAAALEAAGVECVWLSHPLDWNAEHPELAWAPAGRDSRGRGVVVIDDVGVYRAEHFLRAVARGDARVSPDALRARMAGRLARMKARAR